MSRIVMIHNLHKQEREMDNFNKAGQKPKEKSVYLLHLD